MNTHLSLSIAYENHCRTIEMQLLLLSLSHSSNLTLIPTYSNSVIYMVYVHALAPLCVAGFGGATV